MDEVRRLAHDLHSDLWNDRSLFEAIRAQAERVERVARVRVELRLEGDPPTLPPDTSTVLFRVFHVILANALRHSGADRIAITLDSTQGLTLTVADNGRGFDPQRIAANAGFLNIQKRCALIGHVAQCHTAPGQGCSWHIKPYSPHGT